MGFMRLQEYLGMPEDILKKVLHSLSCGKFKVLTRSSGGGADGGDKKAVGIKTTDIFNFNDKFT